MPESRLAAAAAVVALSFAFACSESPTASDTELQPAPLFKPKPDKPGGGGGKPAGETVTVTLSGDVVGDGSSYKVPLGDDGDLKLSPTCPDRSMDVDFSATNHLERSTCNGNRGQGFVFLKIPGIPNVIGDGSVGEFDCVGEPAPDLTGNGRNFGVTSSYFFQDDTGDRDDRYDDDQYNIVITTSAGCPVGARVEATAVDSDGAWTSVNVTSETADLWWWNDDVPIGQGAFAIDVTVTR